MIGGRSRDRAGGADAAPFADLAAAMMYLDTLTYLPDDILAKVDRASMAVSLETRVPFLDHRVVEFAWRLPMSAKIRDGAASIYCEQVLHRHVPANSFDRPKKGFGLPLADWLRGSAARMGRGSARRARLRAEGFFRPEPVRALWREHVRVNDAGISVCGTF